MARAAFVCSGAEVAVDCERLYAMVGGDLVGDGRQRIGLIEGSGGSRRGAVHDDVGAQAGQVGGDGAPEAA